MKKIKIAYWVFTAFIILMFGVFSIPGLMGDAKSVELFKGLGYPLYIMPFLSVAKILGVIAIVIPGYPRLKEWAYAGITFDLSGATYSIIRSGTPFMQWAPMIIFFVFIAGSYICYHKIQQYKAAGVQQGPAFA
ncbi:DoxX-like family protein [Chitinophaga parva]|uniref:DoxX-like family protein n=1 Tax=Chitinophaga parva TaxID=2169414 RepID=A0A2T7BCY5_9BACT|nr:DoxX family protein [Chitinophaga parva]PUZ22942.1 DoxX-like family protein [Chitinophaga parva]